MALGSLIHKLKLMGFVQVEGGFVQGMGWTCLEELVWGDEDHPWLPPGVLHTRGPGAPSFDCLTSNPVVECSADTDR